MRVHLSPSPILLMGRALASTVGKAVMPDRGSFSFEPNLEAGLVLPTLSKRHLHIGEDYCPLPTCPLGKGLGDYGMGLGSGQLSPGPLCCDYNEERGSCLCIFKSKTLISQGFGLFPSFREVTGLALSCTFSPSAPGPSAAPHSRMFSQSGLAWRGPMKAGSLKEWGPSMALAHQPIGMMH